jgi:glucose/arabinose dehydrogenase
VPTSQKLLLAVPDPYGNHNGGHLTYSPDGRLYTSIGDGGGGGDPENRSQNMQSQFGKLLTLDVSKPAAGWLIAALGLRNPWRFSFDRATGDLYIGDVGQGEVEEVSFTPRDSAGLENYGWDLFEGSRRYEEKAAGPGELAFPVAEYNHSRGCSVTGGFVYRGTARPSERGRYIYGDYCSGVVWSFRMAGGAATDLRVEPFKVNSLSSFGENAAGELFALSHDGTIYRVT